MKISNVIVIGIVICISGSSFCYYVPDSEEYEVSNSEEAYSWNSIQNTAERFCQWGAGQIAYGISRVMEQNGPQLEAHGDRLARSIVRSGLRQFDEDNRLEELTDRISNKLNENLQDTLHNADQIISHGFKRNLLLTSICSAFIITTWYGSRVVWNTLDRKLSKPRLHVISSQKSIFEQFKEKLFGESIDKKEPLIYSPKLTDSLQNISSATRAITQKIKEGDDTITYRNLLLWGPPGTGKTLYAMTLAKESNMDFILLSGSSFVDLIEKGEAIEQLHELFNTANYSPKGLIIFIDEAESFLAQRGYADPSGKRSAILNQFLSLTGQASSKFMLVLATNHPELLDSAINDRIVDSINITLPGYIERKRILALYRDLVLLNDKASEDFKDSVKEHFDANCIAFLAELTEGFSGRNLRDLINIIKSNAAVTLSGLVTRELISYSLDTAIEKQQNTQQRFASK